MSRRIILVLSLTLLFVAPLCAEQKEEHTPKIYKIQNRPASDMSWLLQRFVDEGILVNSNFNTITVTADPKGHEAAQNILNEYDVPLKTIEFQFYLIKARSLGGSTNSIVPDKVKAALKDIASLTRYKSFELIDSPIILMTQNGSQKANLTGKGIYNYEIHISKTTAESQITVGQFEIVFYDATETAQKNQMPAKSAAQLFTSFTIAEDEIIVLGASQTERQTKEDSAAIITIVTAKTK